ncbi:MAG: membrane protein insertase YidC [Actinomycetota bacterium]|nr:membrane protein insertase YidC [Actinomycetota bacterium]
MSALDPLNNVVAWVIMRIHAGLGDLFGPNTGLAWGLSIAILVILIRLCLVPLAIKQVHAQRKMAQHQPQLQELRKKYKGDKQALNEATMKFYKENGVNPLAGCLPMIPQMIVFFALFSVLREIAGWKLGRTPRYGLTVPVVQSAQQATIFGVHLADKLLFAHQHVPVHVAIVIALTVLVSAGTTFMTVRQTSKRGLMQTNVDPDNPMAQSQKYMMYIVPFFSLTGLYWQYGLVLYWVTTNLWTLGQQFFMFRNWTVEPAGAVGATAGVTTGPPRVRTTQSALRPSSGGAAKTATGTARTSTGTARTAAGTARTGSAATARNGSSSAGRNGTAAARNGTGTARNGTAAARNGSAAAAGATSGGAAQAKATGSAGSAPDGASNGSGRTRTGSVSGDAAASMPGSPPGSNGGAMRGLLRLGRAKPEPEPEPEVPAAKVVRQQPVRQAKSKRSGKR